MVKARSKATFLLTNRIASANIDQLHYTERAALIREGLSN